MKIELVALGKTREKYLKVGITEYVKRLNFFKPQILYRELTLPSKIYSGGDLVKILDSEADIILKNVSNADYLSLLDEKGRIFSSMEFADYISKMLLSSHRKWVIVIGGAYGFSNRIYERADDLISLSSMTFSHQMVRLFALEQLYRAQTIIHNQSYHHE